MSMLVENFVHLDGTAALVEGSYREQNTAKAYRIAQGTGTGETCCTAFWIKFNQRFALLDPDEPRWAVAIENAIFNALLRVIVPRQSEPIAPGIRYHSPMEGLLERPSNQNTCCEGQGALELIAHPSL